jgi:alpha-1,2-mannosyltransferase
MPIGAYVHYPMVSADMLKRVKNREAGVTNGTSVASSRWRTTAKLAYVVLD